jgi:hypothetical protein
MRKNFESGRALCAIRRAGLTTTLILCAALCGIARAEQNVSLSWQPSTDTNVTGYYLYYGTNSSNYSAKINVGSNNMATITGLTGRSVNYYFAATSYNSSGMESLPSNQALFTTSSNPGPALTATTSLAGNVNSLLVVTNTATDPDTLTSPLTYSLSSAPHNMRINPLTGRLSWRPQLSDGGTTNTVTVQVAENTGLYNTASFNVVVSNAVQVSLSNVVVALGNTGITPVTVAASTPVTKLSFVLDAPSNRVSNVTVTSLLPGVATVTQQPVGAAHSTITITAVSGQVISGTQEVAQVSFLATSSLPSTFSVGTVSTVTATAASGQAVPSGFGGTAQFVLVGAQPLTQSTVETNGTQSLILYGPSGNTFQVQSSTNWMSANGWTAYATSGTLGTNLTQVFTNLPTSATPKFYRILKL